MFNKRSAAFRAWIWVITSIVMPRRCVNTAGFDPHEFGRDETCSKAAAANTRAKVVSTAHRH